MGQSNDAVHKGELLRRLADQEDNFTERKSEGVTARDLRRTLCAFANSIPEDRTAVLFVGVVDGSGMVVGVKNTDSLQRRISEARDDCYPPIEVQSEVLSIQGEKVVAVVVSASSKRPHFAGPAFVRVGSESIQASEEVYVDLIAEHHEPCRVIQRHIGEVISLIDRSVIAPHPQTNASREVGRDVLLNACTQFVVTYTYCSSDRRESKPIGLLDIFNDEEKHRFALRTKR